MTQKVTMTIDFEFADDLQPSARPIALNRLLSHLRYETGRIFSAQHKVAGQVVRWYEILITTEGDMNDTDKV